MKKFLRVSGIILAILVIGGTIAYLILDRPLPKGQKGPEVDNLAQKMLSAVNFSAWQKTDFIHWKFKDAREYWWNKRNKTVKVKWDDVEVYFHTPSRRGRALKDGNPLLDEENQKAVEQAVSFFNNDSFWLAGPMKILDPGTELSAVDEDGRKCLLVTYSQGGITPGDSYLWILNDTGMPVACRMWVKIIPIGGLKATWEDWIQMDSGARIATSHKLGPVSIPIHDVSGERFELPSNLLKKHIFETIP